jgi:hypothetical protein
MRTAREVPISTGGGIAGGRGSVCQISLVPAAVVSKRPAARPSRNFVIEVPPHEINWHSLQVSSMVGRASWPAQG